MLKFLRTFAMAAAMMLPFAMSAQQSLPYTMDFEDETAFGSWTRESCTSNSTRQAAAAKNGSYGFQFYYNTNPPQYLISPELECPSGVQVEFYYKNGSSYTETFMVGYSTTDASTTSFTWGAEITAPSSWTLFSELFPVGTKYVAIKYTANNQFKMYIDDITMAAPASCAKVTGLAVSATTSESVTLSWTSDATNFDIYDMTTHSMVGSSTTNSYTVEDLDANTQYTFGVVVNCGSGDYSDTVTVSARTACVAIDVDADNPFSEGFEGTTFPPDCWSIAHTAGTATSTWIRNTTASNIHTGSGSAQLQDQASGNKNNLVTPVLNIPEANGYQVSFWIKRTTSYASKTKEGVKVWVNTNPDTVGGTPLMHIRRSTTQGEITETAAGWYQYSAVIPTSGNVYIVFEGISEYGESTYIDDIAVEEAPSCLAVTLPHIAAATSESLTLSWSDHANASATYNVYSITDTDTTLLQSGVSDTFYVADDLDVNTAYTFGVMADCGGGDLAAMVTVSGRTECGIIASLPYTMGFEAEELQGTTNALLFPWCWTRINTLTSGTYTYFPYAYNYGTSYGSPINGSRNLYFYASTYGTYADTTGFVMPELDVTTYPMNGNRLSFWAKVSSATTPYNVIVGTMSDPADRSTFTAVDTVNVDATTATKYTVSLATAEATDAYVAFIVPKVASTMCIDDITLEEMPACLEVTSVAIDSVTSSSMTLTWVPNEGNASATYSVYNMADTSLVQANIADTFFVVDDLDANTQYVFGVQANCTTGDAPYTTVSGRTACAAIELPYTETFAAAAGTRDCWTLVSNNTTNAVSSPTSNNYMGFVTYSGHDVMVFNSWSSASDYNQYGYSPLLDASTLTDADSIHVRVVYSTHGTADQLKFGYTTAASTNPTDYTWVGPFSTSGYDTWATFEANLPLDAVQLAVNYTTSSSNYKAYVDSVVVTGYTIPSCPAPTGLAVSNISGEGATLSWNGEAGSYVVYQATATDTTVYDGSVSDNSLELTDLLPNTAYTFGVAANCGSDESAIVTVSFTTACAAVAIPYTEDFEASSAAFSCWSMVNCVSSAGLTTSGAYSGSGCFDFFYTTNPPQYLISPELSGTEDGVSVSFMYKTSGSYTEKFNVGYSTTTNDTSAFTWGTEVSSNTDVYTEYSEILPADVKYVAIRSNANNAWHLYIDSMVFGEAPACMPVTDLTVDSVTATSVFLSWNGTATAYNVYSATGAVIASGITATNYEVTGLTASTGYTFGVTAVCGTDESPVLTVDAMTDCVGGSCTITIVGTDEFGDGWTGAYIDILQNGASVGHFTVEGDEWANEEPVTESGTFSVCAGVPVTFMWNDDNDYYEGQYADEVSFVIKDGNDTVLYTVSDGSTLTGGVVFFTVADACGSNEPPAPPVPDSMQVNVAVNNLAWGTTIPAPGTHYFHVGEQASVVAVPTAGNHLEGWSINVSAYYPTYDTTITYIDTTVTYAIPDVFDIFGGWTVEEGDESYVWTVTAIFAEGEAPVVHDSLTIITSVNDETMGTITPAPGTSYYAYDESYAVSVQPNAGYQIYSLQVSYSHPLYGVIYEETLTDSADIADMLLEMGDTMVVDSTDLGLVITVNVIFAPEGQAPEMYTVTVNVNDETMGHVNGIPTAAVASGTVVHLTAVAESGYRFVNWSNGVTTTALDLTVTSDTTVTANFELIPVNPDYYTVTVNYDATMGEVYGAPEEDVVAGSSVTLTARAAEGYKFVGWVIGTDTIADNPYTFTVIDNVTITAVFKSNIGIADVELSEVNVYSVNDMIYINGAEGQQVYLFDVNGRVLNSTANATERVAFRVANTGVYLVKVGNAAAKRVVVMQ